MNDFIILAVLIISGLVVSTISFVLGFRAGVREANDGMRKVLKRFGYDL